MSYGHTPTQEIERLRGELEYVSRAISTTARKIIRDRVNAALAFTQPETALDDAYNELCMAVERKFPGETRHQTALRYIREAEARASEPGQASKSA